jgi:hypothetical protein
MGADIGIKIGLGSSAQSWSPYWTKSNLFEEFWDLSKTSGGVCVGNIRHDNLTITGSGLNAIYAVPDNNTYKADDTDYVFHKSDGSISILCDGNRLIGYDFQRVIVKYLDVAPYTIQWVGILKLASSPSTAEMNKMRDSFHLSVWWSNTLSFYGVIKGNRGSQQSTWTPESIIPAIITDGNTFGWYDSLDLTTITKDGSGFVSSWRDKLLSGHDLLMATPTKQPQLGVNGVVFDGSNDCMKCVGFTLVQPTSLYLVIKVNTWVADAVICDGDSNDMGDLVMTPTTPSLKLYSGGYSDVNTDLVVGSFVVMRVIFSGANSKIRINALTPTGGNAYANSMNGFTLGSNADLQHYFANISVKGIIGRIITDNSINSDIIYNFLKTTYGI